MSLRLYKTYANYTPASWAVILAALTLALIGLITLQRLATAGDAEWAHRYAPYLTKQAVFLGVAVVAMIVVAATSYLKVARQAYLLFAITLLLLFAVLLFGKLGQHVPFLAKVFPSRNFSHRWISFGIVQIQPSEFLKITYILGLAYYLRYRENYRRLAGLIGPFAFTIIPMILILLEPDLGTVMLLMPVLFLMLFAAGAKVKHLLAVVLMMIVASPALFAVMKPYQRGRLLGTLLQVKPVRDWYHRHPELRKYVYLRDNTRKWPEGYQLYHSKLAVASGTVVGYPNGRGPYTAGVFRLPDCHNDFVFALIAHQFGFVGAVMVIVLYLILLTGLVEIAGAVTEPAGRLIAVGVLAMIVTQSIINMAITVGLMPITGATLPFVSYGGSSLLTFFILIALAISVDRTRPIDMGRRPFEFRNDDHAQ